jgi:FkbM family methyltransferase
MDEYNLTYSQNREDLIIRAFLKNIKKGFYVDVGANHPTIDSVTKVFYDEGWKGINIEPNKTLNKLLKDERPNDINLQIGVSDKPGQLVLRSYDIGHGLSTFSKEMQKDYTEHPSRVTKEYHDYKVDTLPLKDIFDKYNVPQINFMKIDVEGYEYEVIDSNDWAKYRPQVLCIEANHMIKNWKPLLAKAKYELVYFDGLNNYYLSKECISLKENFSYVNDLLLGKPIIKADVFNELKDRN